MKEGLRSTVAAVSGPIEPVRVEIVAPVRKRCPFRDEIDWGEVTITYETNATAIELHSLAAYLATFTDRPMSHEDFVVEVRLWLDRPSVEVSSRWTTAGMEVECSTSPTRRAGKSVTRCSPES